MAGQPLRRAFAFLTQWVSQLVTLFYELLFGRRAGAGPHAATHLLLADRLAGSETSQQSEVASAGFPASISHAVTAVADAQLLLVMRHGHRQDDEDPDWDQSAARPWDPPLSNKGRQQARLAGAQLKGLGIELVVTSPFVRCLQTSAEIVVALGLKKGQWAVDWGLSEVCGQRQICARRSDVEPTLHSKLDKWMWDGSTLEGALAEFVAQETTCSGVGFAPVNGAGIIAEYPETSAEAVGRYHTTLQGFLSMSRAGNVLLVSHGEVVGSAVTLQQPTAVVYEVVHTGYVRMKRKRGPLGGWEAWQLDCAPGETGVSWFADDS